MKFKNMTWLEKGTLQVRDNKIVSFCIVGHVQVATESAIVAFSWENQKHVILILLRFDAMQQLLEISVQPQNNKTYGFQLRL